MEVPPSWFLSEEPDAQAALEVVRASTDRLADRAEHGQDRADHQKHYSDGRQDADASQPSDDEQDQTENDHDTSRWGILLWATPQRSVQT